MAGRQADARALDAAGGAKLMQTLQPLDLPTFLYFHARFTRICWNTVRATRRHRASRYRTV
jgi:hypothetical protein